MWKNIEVKMVLLEKLCGRVPQNKKIIKRWLSVRKAPEGAEEEVLETVEDSQEKVTLSFQKDEKGIFLRGGTIKAHLKDCSNQIKDVLGVKNLRSKIANKVFVQESRIYLKRNDSEYVFEVDGEFDQPIHVITGLGPRSALKTIRFLTKPNIEFTLKILEDKEVDIKIIEKIFEYGSIHGFGGERGMGEGRYEVRYGKET